MTAGEQPERRRLFFALWPDAATAASIVRATKDAVRVSGGRPTAKERLHVTVAFLGELDPAEHALARDVMPIQTGAFDLTLDTLGYFPRSRVLWLGPRSVPAELRELEQRLSHALEDVGFQHEPEIYRPHMTLVRRARAADAEVAPIEWRVEALALVESLPDGRSVHYEVLERWPLQP